MVDVVLAKLDGEEQQHRKAPPFGILYLADALETAGYSVRLFHEAGTQADIRSLVNLVAEEAPLFVGFSTLTGPAILPTARASQTIKAQLSIPVVWGGLHVTMLPEQTLANDFVDVVAMGEGEETVVELARALSRRSGDPEALAGVAGIAFRQDGQTVVNQARPFLRDLDKLRPAWHLLDVDRYFQAGQHFYTDVGSQFRETKIAAVLSSRGCPWRCGFCYNQFVNKRSFRAHSAERIAAEIQEYREHYGVTAVIFEDDGFFTDRDRALAIIRQIGVPWTSSIRANYLASWGEEFVRALGQHHCAELRIGAESGSQRVLELMHKDITVEQIVRSAELCQKHGIKASFGFMVGIPGESWDDVLMTLDLMDRLEAMGRGIAVVGPCIFTPYPGTPLFDAAIERGFVPPGTLEEWSIRVFDHKQPLAPYADGRIRFVGYYRRLAKGADGESLAFALPRQVLRQMARFRWRHRFFRFAVDYQVPAAMLDWIARLGPAGSADRLRRITWK